MQRIHFSTTEPFLTGDDLADSLLDYALTLAQYRRHDVVRLPAMRGSDGTPTVVTLLLGPVSQLAVWRADVLEEIRDPAVEADLRARADRLRGTMDSPFAGFDETAFDAPALEVA